MKAQQIIKAFMTIIALPVLSVAVLAAPAEAASTICETFGSYCVGAPTINGGDPVEETSGGRQINLVAQGYKVNGNEVYQLAFAADFSKCVGVSNQGYAEVKSCNSGDSASVNWERIPVSSSNGLAYEYKNIDWAFDVYLSGSNNGTRMYVSPLGSPSGVRQKFN